MPIPVTCDECFRDYQVPERFAGRKVKCKGCGATMTVPDGVEVAEDGEDEFAGLEAAPAVGLPPGRTRPPAPRRDPAQPSVWKTAGFWIAVTAGSAMVAILLCCGGMVVAVRRSIDAGPAEIYANQPEHGDPTAPFPVARIPVPQFPDLGEPAAIAGSQVRTWFVDLGAIPANDGAAGMKTAMRVYLPPGEHAPASLPCVLVAPAGTDLLTGADIYPDDEYHDETLPYAEAGMAVVQYSIDGGGDEIDDRGNPYLQFRAAGAGVVNTRNALEFVLAKLPMVDPDRVYAAGHSSAGTLALLAAEHEPRLAGAIAYMPATDVEERFKEMLEVPLLGAAFPGLEEFVTQSSPLTHAAALKKPVFLFHARDDSNVPFSQSERFAERLRANGTDVTFESVDAGDHYAPMLTQGIPRAIEWLKMR